jgi:tetratricopeptide (TPR) repeat protein
MTHWKLVIGVVVLLAAPLAVEAAPGEPGDADSSAPAATRPAGPLDVPTGAADANAAAEDDLAKLLRELSPEDVQKLIRSAVESRLKVERQQAAEEIKEDLLADPADVAAAVKLLDAGPKNTQKDNIDRILRAMGKVDLHVGKAMELLEAKKYPEAVQAIEKDLNVQEATYRNAARYTLYARAMAAQGKGYEAAEAFQKVLVVMGDKISFAAAAAMESARIYEELQRFTYAAQMYAFAVRNYGLTLDADALDTIDKKMKEYSEFAKDPLGWAGGMMGEVKNRLGRNDSGQETQKKEEKIVAVITDLIKTAEEQQQAGQGQGQSQQRQKGQKQGECEGEGQGQAQGSSKNGPKGTQQPSSPAQVSALVPGAVARPTKRSEVHNSAETGDWATLPPRERQKLEELRKKVMSERYRDIISKYRTKISDRRANE